MKKIWIFNKPTDIWLLSLPVWLTWLICFLLPENILQQSIPLWFWVVIILGIDVTHVWSTIFRTYLDKEEFHSHKKLLISAPLIGLILFFILALSSTTLFWSILAYLAVYHFIKQQYGFMQIYRAKYGFLNLKKRISDKTAIYVGMLYPLFYWHINYDRHFNWFIDGDFLNIRTWLNTVPIWNDVTINTFNQFTSFIYFCILIFWLFEEVYLHMNNNLRFPWGKVLWILTTSGNWYLGIVYFNSDLAFSLTNVVAHGVPYMVLIFFYVEGKRQIKSNVSHIKAISNICLMILAIFVLAYGEEYLWDMFLFRENEAFFSKLFSYPFPALKTYLMQALALAALSVPQVTHYILDGFIWKTKTNPYIKTVILR
ncbi:hypothetical protein JMN32_12445 [Fulvivirga sp. 29W222]|uniref:Uncharacterized protein n=1 Tax=Fulvivirga marina TaxID=2494733 RepID=A0A937KEF6_9BACT|nr:hypothetical protein [Fulvivirga marina]MBL6447123.1 hypothetical protein [Fulvivirga marina]